MRTQHKAIQGALRNRRDWHAEILAIGNRHRVVDDFDFKQIEHIARMYVGSYRTQSDCNTRTIQMRRPLFVESIQAVVMTEMLLHVFSDGGQLGLGG